MTQDMSRDDIQDEFDKFFEFDDPANKTVVTSVSCRLFADHVARRAVAKAVRRVVDEWQKPWCASRGLNFINRLREMASEADERAKW
jgi:hypothetical protein